MTISYEAFTNTIAEKYGVPEACGPTLYTIQGEVPTFVTLDYAEYDSSFSLTFDMTAESNSKTYTISLLVTM